MHCANCSRLGGRGEESVTLLQRKREKSGEKREKRKKKEKKTHEYLNIIRVRFPTYENKCYGR